MLGDIPRSGATTTTFQNMLVNSVTASFSHTVSLSLISLFIFSVRIMSSSSSCTSGELAFSITSTVISLLCALIITYFTVRLIQWYRCSKTRSIPPDPWSFWSSILYLALSIGILLKCVLHSLSNCHSLTVAASTHSLVFEVIFSDLYVFQLYALWIVLLIRIYFILSATPFRVTRLSIRLYSILILLCPLVTALLCIPSLYTIFLVLSLSIGIFMTLSIVLLYLFKLIQVFSVNDALNGNPANALNQNGLNPDDLKSLKSEDTEQRQMRYRSQLTRHSLLAVISCSASLIVLFILILHFIFAVYSVHYQYQQRFLETVHLIDVVVTALCIVMMNGDHSESDSLRLSMYYRLCGCVDAVCQYWCTQLVDPTVTSDSAHLLPVDALQKIKAQRVSVTLQRPTSDLEHLHSHHIQHVAPNEKHQFIDSVESEREQMVSEMARNSKFQFEPEIAPQTALRTAPRNVPRAIPSKFTKSRKSTKRIRAASNPQRSRNTLKVRDHRYWRDRGDIDLDHKSLPPLKLKGDSEKLHDRLRRNGFDPKYIKRAMAVYEVFDCVLVL